MRSLTVKTKQAALAKQFEYGAHRKRKHSLTKQRICNMVSGSNHIDLSLHCHIIQHMKHVMNHMKPINWKLWHFNGQFWTERKYQLMITMQNISLSMSYCIYNVCTKTCFYLLVSTPPQHLWEPILLDC